MKRFTLTLLILTVLVPMMSYAQSSVISIPEQIPTSALSPILLDPLQQKYQDPLGEPVKILIVPGHDLDFSGAMYTGIKESAMNVQMAQVLANKLAEDPKLLVTVARNPDGSYIPELTYYFDRNESRVTKFIKDAKKRTARLIKLGDIDQVDNNVPHGDAPVVAAYRLYAMNKWIDENKFDLVIHIHFNDYGGRPYEAPGAETGYSVYVPDNSLPNGESALPIGDAVANRLNDIWKPGTGADTIGKRFANGLIKDYKLIALGSYGTLKTPSLLIENAFIYEPQVQPGLLAQTASSLSKSMSLGLHEYLTGTISTEHTVSYVWSTNLLPVPKPIKGKKVIDSTPSNDVLMLQYALAELGMYPPKDMTFADCPFSGILGSCTELAVRALQAQNKLSIDGKVGPVTRATLNKMFK